MAIRYYNDDSDFRFLGKRKTAKWLCAVAEEEGFAVGNVSYIFCSSSRHRQINNQYLGHDYFTDVITFDDTELLENEPKMAENSAKNRAVKGTINGDIFIDPQTVFLNANELNTNKLTELQRVVVHGVLHLCGYGDKTPAQETAMRGLEDKYLTLFYEEHIEDGVKK